MYEYADRVLRQANRLIRAAFAKRRATSFDRLNVMAETAALYDELAQINLQQLRKIAMYYASDESEKELMEVDARGTPSKKPGFARLNAKRREPDISWLLWFLEEVYDVTAYSYNAEIARKRDRLAEALIGTNGAKHEYDKALLYWAQMLGWFAIGVADEAIVRRYAENGVHHVRWNTIHDERRCSKCKALSGKVFAIDKIPKKPHPGCRCYLTPAN